MTKDIRILRRNSTVLRANLLNFVMFLTGVLLGCVLMYAGGVTGAVIADQLPESLFQSSGTFPVALLANGKFLLLLWLLAFLHCGAMLIPPVFGAEGIFLGGTVWAVMAEMGTGGAVLLAILLMFRLVLVLPYGFLLGSWAVVQSLDFGKCTPVQRHDRAVILLLTGLVLLAASFLECTVAHWLGGIYYLIGV